MNTIYYTDISNIKLNNINIDKINKSVISKNKNQKDEFKVIQSYIGYLLLEKILRDNGITSFDYDIKPNGKPYLLNSNIHFNIAHSKNIVAVIISNSEVGLDIEFIDHTRNLDNISSYLFSENELSHYNSLTDNEKINYFYQTWVQKEAYFKMNGIGLTKKFKNITLNYPVREVLDDLNNRYYLTATCDYETLKIVLVEL